MAVVEEAKVLRPRAAGNVSVSRRSGRHRQEPARSFASMLLGAAMSSGSREAPVGPSRWARTFGLDLRSLAVFRIGLGLLLLLDLAGRAKTLREHYTGEGVFPRELAAEYVFEPPFFRMFLWNEAPAVQAALFALFALLALLLVLGWRTRLVSVLVFCFLAALVRRNHFVCHTGDTWLKALTFWAMFLPLGARWSLDARAGRGGGQAGPRQLDLATFGVVLQLALFYWGAGFLKSNYGVWQRGEAVWIFTHVVEYTRPFGAWLGRFPAACEFLTRATLVLEVGAAFLILSPFRTARVRTLLWLLLAGFHLTLWATIHIGIFQLVCIVANTLLLPGEVWDRLARRWPLFAARPGASASPGALARLARPTWLASQALLVPALLVILVSNANTSAKAALGTAYEREDPGLLRLPRLAEDLGRQTSTFQNWNMFTDIESLYFGWFLVLGRQEDGTVVDVLAGEPFRALEYPAHYARFFPNHNSRRYWRELTLGGREFLQKPMCDWLAREWQAAGRPALTHLALFHIARKPLSMREFDEVRPIAVQWEAEHAPLKDLPAEERDLWLARREAWRTFLGSLPRTVPLTDPTRANVGP